MRVKTTDLQMFARPERAVPPAREGLAVVHAKRPTIGKSPPQYADEDE
jgi:hypothetical protein